MMDFERIAKNNPKSFLTEQKIVLLILIALSAGLLWFVSSKMKTVSHANDTKHSLKVDHCRQIHSIGAILYGSDEKGTKNKAVIVGRECRFYKEKAQNQGKMINYNIGGSLHPGNHYTFVKSATGVGVSEQLFAQTNSKEGQHLTGKSHLGGREHFELSVNTEQLKNYAHCESITDTSYLGDDGRNKLIIANYVKVSFSPRKGGSKYFSKNDCINVSTFKQKLNSVIGGEDHTGDVFIHSAATKYLSRENCQSPMEIIKRNGFPNNCLCLGEDEQNKMILESDLRGGHGQKICPMCNAWSYREDTVSYDVDGKYPDLESLESMNKAGFLESRTALINVERYKICIDQSWLREGEDDDLNMEQPCLNNSGIYKTFEFFVDTLCLGDCKHNRSVFNAIKFACKDFCGGDGYLFIENTGENKLVHEQSNLGNVEDYEVTIDPLRLQDCPSLGATMDELRLRDCNIHEFIVDQLNDVRLESKQIMLKKGANRTLYPALYHDNVYDSVKFVNAAGYGDDSQKYYDGHDRHNDKRNEIGIAHYSIMPNPGNKIQPDGGKRSKIIPLLDI